MRVLFNFFSPEFFFLLTCNLFLVNMQRLSLVQLNLYFLLLYLCNSVSWEAKLPLISIPLPTNKVHSWNRVFIWITLHPPTSSPSSHEGIYTKVRIYKSLVPKSLGLQPSHNGVHQTIFSNISEDSSDLMARLVMRQPCYCRITLIIRLLLPASLGRPEQKINTTGRLELKTSLEIGNKSIEIGNKKRIMYILYGVFLIFLTAQGIRKLLTKLLPNMILLPN